MSDLRRKVVMKGAGSLMGPPQGLPPFASSQIPSNSSSGLVHSSDSHSKQDDLSAVSWELYFESKESIHGRTVYRLNCPNTNNNNYLFLLHGAGLSALSWALVAQDFRQSGHVVAMDHVGHGESDPAAPDYDYSLERLVNDCKSVIESILESEDAMERGRVVLIGHSLGGALAVHLAHLLPKHLLAGVIVIDVVEGSAMQALPSMRAVIQNRPPRFRTLPHAIQWAKSTGYVRNLASARVSIPSQLREVSTGEYAGSWEWRVDLIKTEPFWKSWFQGLSDAFLRVAAPRLLILAGTDRLDKTLLIGQMQGKFQLEILPQAGHSIQEDDPLNTAQKVTDFLRRYRPVVPSQHQHSTALPTAIVPSVAPNQ
eukprot:TRINITY_DN5655_c0_g1_i1.p1 TRINITY_DN5655_c0_g1~~TRINITY_DN5655_c0_g1_i1.p1  ORF type:complete len:369 (+),score=33.58 TRINITY_DN5655_c0_g1_i1:19-1125(+)